MKVLKRRRKRVHGQSSSQLMYVLGALILLVIAQISVSMKLLHKLTSDDESLLSNNQFIHTIKDQIQSNNDHHQQMVILAGPHKTGNFYYFLTQMQQIHLIIFNHLIPEPITLQK